MNCEHCAGSGEVALSSSTLSYRGPGPVPDYARGVIGARCDQCGGSGEIEMERIAKGGTDEQQAHRAAWYDEFCGCLQDMGGSAYDEGRVIGLYVQGYSPADAAGEEICEEDE
jgi:hypothetical protein